MFEVGAQLNTSCLKKTDARVEQEMRARPRRGRGEGGWVRDRKGCMRKTCADTVKQIYGEEQEVILQDEKIDGERQKGGLQWCNVDVAAEIQYAANMIFS